MKNFMFTMTKSQHKDGPGMIVVRAENRDKARQIMIDNYGYKWAFQYENLHDIHPMDRKVLARIP